MGFSTSKGMLPADKLGFGRLEAVSFTSKGIDFSGGERQVPAFLTAQNRPGRFITGLTSSK
jgi:hypothetical protein